MPGIIDQRDVGILSVVFELRDRLAHLVAIGVEHAGDIEAEVAEEPVDVARILSRVGQYGQLLVFALADHQRHPVHGAVLRRRRKRQCDQAGAE